MTPHRFVPGRTDVLWVAACCTAAVGLGGAISVLGPSGVIRPLVAGLMVFVVAYGFARPAVLISLLVAAAPFQRSIPQFGRLWGTNEVLLFATAAACLRFVRLRRVPRQLVLGLSLIIVGSVVVLYFAFDFGYATWAAARWTAIAVVMVASFSIFPIGVRVSRRVLDIVVATAALVAIFGLLQRLGIYTFVGRAYDKDISRASFTQVRVDSTWGFYTQYASHMAIGVLCALAATLNSVYLKLPRTRIVFYSGCLLATFVGLAISLSRGGLLAVFVGGIVILARAARDLRRILGRVLAVTVALGVVIAVTPQTVVQEFTSRVRGDASASEGDIARFALRRTGASALASHPFGIGFGSFTHYLHEHPDPNIKTDYFHSHWTPVQVGLDDGWVGLAGFGIVAAGCAIRARRSRWLGLFPYGAAAAALAGFAMQTWYDYLFVETGYLILVCSLVWVLYAMPFSSSPDNYVPSNASLVRASE